MGQSHQHEKEKKTQLFHKKSWFSQALEWQLCRALVGRTSSVFR
jgi:hypothetical protein